VISDDEAALRAGREDFEAVNPLELPRIDRDGLLSGAADGIYIEPAAGNREFERCTAFVDDPDEIGMFGPSIGGATYFYPPPFVAGFSNAQLTGYRTILTPAGRFFADQGYVWPDEFEQQLKRISGSEPFQNEETGLRPAGHDGRFYLERGGREERVIEGTAVFLGSDEPYSYGAFLFRVVPKAIALRALGLLDMPCIVYAAAQSFIDLLELCGIAPANIVQHNVRAIFRIERSIMVSMRNPHAYLDPESFEFYKELRARYGTPATGRKIYVSRSDLARTGRGSTRVMTNEGELIARLRSMNFDIIEPENLSVREQILAFSSASMVVGPAGSGMFNTMFCHPGTKVIDIQSEPQWIYSYTGMYSSLRMNYGIFIGRSDPADTNVVHRRFTVNIDALVSRIRRFALEAGP
jgi:capsular polysaccharide biosynthesis protein